MIKSANTFLLALLFVGLAGCESVPVSTTDTVAPLVSLVGGHSETKTVSGTSAPAIVEVPLGRELAAIASTRDDGGAKSITVTFVSGGFFRDDAGSLVSSITKTNSAAGGTALSTVVTGARLVPNDPSTNMVIRAIGEDFAGNVVNTSTITFVQKPLPVARISASQTSINRGSSTTLTYETDNATEATLDGVSLGTLNGTEVKTPATTTTYVLEAESNVGSDRASVQVRVIQPPLFPEIRSFSVSPSVITAGDSVSIQWDTRRANDNVVTDNGVQVLSERNSTGQRTRTLTAPGNHIFKLTATNSDGSDVATESVMVRPPSSSGPACFDTCSGSAVTCFTKLDDYFEAGVKQGSIWEVDLTLNGSAGGLGDITSIKNKESFDMFLEVDGDIRAILAGATSTGHSGQPANALYTALILHPASASVISPTIEICHQ